MLIIDNVKFFFIEILPAVACNLAKRYVKVAVESIDIDDRNYRPVHLTHFIPCTPFKKVTHDTGTFMERNRIKDLSNEDEYLDDREVRWKYLALTLATPIVQAVGVLLSVALRIIKFITLAHFWYPFENEYPLCDRAWSFGKDILRIAFAPAIYIGMVVSPIYGLAFINNGRKLYATFERCIYGDALLAPCFQPKPTSHLFGTSIDQQGW